MLTDNYRSSTDRKGKTYLQKRRQGCRLDHSSPAKLGGRWPVFCFSRCCGQVMSCMAGLITFYLVSNSICTRGRGAYCIEFRSGMHLSWTVCYGTTMAPLSVKVAECFQSHIDKLIDSICMAYSTIYACALDSRRKGSFLTKSTQTKEPLRTTLVPISTTSSTIWRREE